MKHNLSEQNILSPLVKGLDDLVIWLFKKGTIEESEIVRINPRVLLNESLANWARHRMGKDFKRYMDEAIKNFLFIVAVRAIWLEEKPSNIVSNAYLPIPQRLGKRNLRSPADPFSHMTVYRLMNCYEDILPNVRDIKKKRWRNPVAQAMCYKENLPGISTERANKYCAMKASEIAMDYAQWKYKLGISPDAVKKWLSIVRNRKASFKILAKIARQVGERANS